MLRHNYIGTEHLLLGLISEKEGIAARALESLNISHEATTREIEEAIGRGEAAPTGHMPFTPRAKKVMELALRESRQLGHRHIGTEHLLLGLVREGAGEGVQILQRLGTPLEQVRQAVNRLLPEDAEGPSAEVSEEVDPAEREERQTEGAAARFHEREKIVLTLLLEGSTNRQIAETLGISASKVAEIIHLIIEELEKTSEE